MKDRTVWTSVSLNKMGRDSLSLFDAYHPADYQVNGRTQNYALAYYRIARYSRQFLIDSFQCFLMKAFMYPGYTQMRPCIANNNTEVFPQM